MTFLEKLQAAKAAAEQIAAEQRTAANELVSGIVNQVKELVTAAKPLAEQTKAELSIEVKEEENSLFQYGVVVNISLFYQPEKSANKFLISSLANLEDDIIQIEVQGLSNGAPFFILGNQSKLYLELAQEQLKNVQLKNKIVNK